MTQGHAWRPAAFVFLFLLTAPTIRARELGSTFEQLRVLVKPGDTVTVTDVAGDEVQGRIGRLSSSVLALALRGDRCKLREDEVATIRRRGPDSLANGARWGMGTGAGIGLATAVAVAAEHAHGFAATPGTVLVCGSLGAGLEVGLDSLMSDDRVIYARATSPASPGVSPIIGAGRLSWSMSVRF